MARSGFHALLENWRLKLAALGLSVFLWALVQTEPRSQESLPSVPVVVDVQDTAWTLAAPPAPQEVEIQLGGPAREIIRLARTGTSLRVPLGRVASPDTVVTLRREWVALDPGSGLRVESISPSSARIFLEPAVTRTLPVAIRTRGALPEHLALVSPLAITPRLVRVRGARSRVEGLDSLPTEPFDLESVRASGLVTLPLDTTGLGGAELIPPAVALGVRVEERITRTLPDLPVALETALDGIALEVDPPAVTLHLDGPRSLVTAVEPARLRVYVSAASLEGMSAAEERRVPLRVEGVPAMVGATLEPRVVRVRRAATRGPSR